MDNVQQYSRWKVLKCFWLEGQHGDSKFYKNIILTNNIKIGVPCDQLLESNVAQFCPKVSQKAVTTDFS